jgi:hypothetical protein
MHQRAEAIVSGNNELLLSFYAPTFKIKLNNRTMTLQELKDGPRLEKDNSVRTHSTTIKNVKWESPVAKLVVRHSGSVTQTLKGSSVRELFTVTEQQEEWIRLNGQWKLKSIANVSIKDSATLLNGKKVSSSNAPVGSWQVPANESDRPILESGHGIIFIYRLNDKAVIRVPVVCDDAPLARMTGGTFLKVKLLPGKHTLRSDKGTPVAIDLQAGQIVFLLLDIEAGFPRGRGVLSLDESAVGPSLYKSPRDAKLNPLGAENIDDPTRIMN